MLGMGWVTCYTTIRAVEASMGVVGIGAAATAGLEGTRFVAVVGSRRHCLKWIEVIMRWY